MNEWAVLDGDTIVNVVTSSKPRAELAKQFLGYRIERLYGLPARILDSYRYWAERP